MDSFVFMMDSLPLLSIIALTPAVAAAIILLLPQKMIDAARTFAVETTAEECRSRLGELLRPSRRNADAGILCEDMHQVLPCAGIEIIFL